MPQALPYDIRETTQRQSDFLLDDTQFLQFVCEYYCVSFFINMISTEIFVEHIDCITVVN